MEKHPGPHRAPGSIPFGHEEKHQWEQGQTLLGDPEMSSSREKQVSGMGIQKRTPMLVHQWNNLPW
jgi:hypothetical protein